MAVELGADRERRRLHQVRARRTQLTGFLSFGSWSNDEPLQPFTINTALPAARAAAEPRPRRSANVFSTNLNLVSRPADDWRVGARFRHYGYNNETPQFAITAVRQLRLVGQHVGHRRTGALCALPDDLRCRRDLDRAPPLALTAGYTHNGTGHDFRIFESTGEDVLRLVADAVGSQWLTFRAEYEFADRRGSGLDEAVLDRDPRAAG